MAVKVSEDFVPRQWQCQCSDAVIAAKLNNADRALIYGVPGCGKTLGSLYAAINLCKRMKTTNVIIVVTPSIETKFQWIEEAALLGLTLVELKDKSQLANKSFVFGIDGYVITYQTAVFWKKILRIFCDDVLPIVVFDEVHHTAGSNKDSKGNEWGKSIEIAFCNAYFKLCSSGTPFRKGKDPIAFVVYNDEGKVIPTFSYNYIQALRDGVCRRVEFAYFDGNIDFTISDDGSRNNLTFEQEVSKGLSSKRLGASLYPKGKFLYKMLESAHKKLLEIRKDGLLEANKVAGGLVVAIDIKRAEAIGAVLEKISGEKPIIVHSDLINARELINEFRNGTHKWIIAIGMLSEGVNIKRLRVGVYASRIKTPLYFHQFVGRFLRVMYNGRESSFIFMPRDPDLTKIALKIQEEIYHALGEEEVINLKSKNGRGGTRNNSDDGLSDIQTDGRMTAQSDGKYFYPIEYQCMHLNVISDMKRDNPVLADSLTSLQILSLAVHFKQIPAPVDILANQGIAA